MNILHSRHDNLSKLEHLPFVLDVLELQLTIEKCSRQDQLFMRRHIQSIVHVLYRLVLFFSIRILHLTRLFLL